MKAVLRHVSAEELSGRNYTICSLRCPTPLSGALNICSLMRFDLLATSTDAFELKLAACCCVPLPPWRFSRDGASNNRFVRSSADAAGAPFGDAAISFDPARGEIRFAAGSGAA